MTYKEQNLPSLQVTVEKTILLITQKRHLKLGN